MVFRRVLPAVLSRAAFLTFLFCVSALSAYADAADTFARLGSTRSTLGELCVSQAGEVYAENEKSDSYEIVRLDKSGDGVWRKAIQPMSRATNSLLSQCSLGGVTVATHGISSECNSSSKEVVPGHVVRLSEGGDLTWEADVLFGDAQVYLFSIAASGPGATYVGGSYQYCKSRKEEGALLAVIDAQGAVQIIPLAVPEATRIRFLDWANGLLIVGGRTQYGEFLAALDEKGELRWSLSDDAMPIAGSLDGLATTSPGGIFVCGYDALKRQLQVAHLSSNGSLVWARSLSAEGTPTMSSCMLKRKPDTSVLLVSQPGYSKYKLRVLTSEGMATAGIDVPQADDLTRGFDVSGPPEILYLGATPGPPLPARTYILSIPLSMSASQGK